jgi:cell division protein FtsQ
VSDDRGTRRWRLVRATSTSIPASVRRFNARARTRRIRSARPWFIAAAVLALAGILSFVGYGTSLLGVSTITVHGDGFVSAADIRGASGVTIGTPLASVDTGSVAKRVRGRLVGVRDATVHRDWPSTLVIDVTLRTAVAAVPRDVGFTLLDGSGVAFRTVVTVPGDVMVIDLAAPGPADPSTQAALSVLASLPGNLRDQVRKISAPAPAEIQLSIDGDRTIIWGDNADNRTKARVALSLLRNPGKVIDVSAPNVVTVR